MALPSKNTELSFFIDGQEVNAPVNWREISVLATFENDNVQANITVDSFDFALDAKAIIDDWIRQGRIFEGIPFQIVGSNVNNEIIVFDGFLDCTKDLDDLRDNQKIRLSITKKEGLNRLDEQLEGLTYGFLKDQAIITADDYVDVKYVIDKPNSAIDTVFLAFVTAYLIDATIQQIQEVSDAIATIAGLNSTPPAGSLGATVFAIANAILQAAKLAALVIALADLAKRIFNALFEPVRTHKGIRLSTALRKAFAKLGYTFETDIENFDNYIYLPSNNGIDERGAFSSLLSPATIKEGIPKSSDYGYVCLEMIELAKRYFNCLISVRGNVIQFRPKGSPFWKAQASYSIPDVLIESVQYNTEELAGDKILRFDTDVTDLWTIDESTFTGTNYEVITSLKGEVPESNNFIKGLEEVQFNVCLGNRKDKLNPFDTALKGLASLFDATINAFGGKSNLAATIDAKTGVLRVSQNNHSKPKLLYLNDSGQIPSNQRSLLSAKHSYESFHVFDSFVEGEGQKILYNSVRTGFGLDDFLQVIENAYIRTTDNQIAQVGRIEWNIGQDAAVFNYFVRSNYTDQLQETKIQG